MSKSNRFLERLATGKPLVMAEGYIFELERRGYLSAGPFCPEVLLDRPDVIKNITEDFVRCGSEVIMACTYYINRPKLRLIGKPGQDILHELNKIALNIAREVQQQPGNEHCLICGDISNSTDFKSGDEQSRAETLDMFREQAKWAKEGGVDFIVAETISSYEEASLALQAIKETGLPAVVNLTCFIDGKTRDGVSIEDTFTQLKQQGADVVGINCMYGPTNIIPVIKQVRSIVQGPIAALPVPYRCSHKYPFFVSLEDESTKDKHFWGKPFPTALEPFLCNRYDVAEFGKRAVEAGAQIVGLCCGNAPYFLFYLLFEMKRHFTRQLAEALGFTTQQSKYSPKMELHFMFGKKENKEKEYDNWGEKMKIAQQENE